MVYVLDVILSELHANRASRRCVRNPTARSIRWVTLRLQFAAGAAEPLRVSGLNRQSHQTGGQHQTRECRAGTGDSAVDQGM